MLIQALSYDRAMLDIMELSENPDLDVNINSTHKSENDNYTPFAGFAFEIFFNPHLLSTFKVYLGKTNYENDGVSKIKLPLYFALPFPPYHVLLPGGRFKKRGMEWREKKARESGGHMGHISH